MSKRGPPSKGTVREMARAIPGLKELWSKYGAENAQRIAAAFRYVAELRGPLINFAIVVSIGALVVAVVLDLCNDAVVVDTVSVAKSLQEEGVTEKGAAQSLVGEVLRINRAARTNKQSRDFTTGDRFDKASSIKIASTGIDVGTVVGLLRDLVWRRTERVTGELAVASEKGTWPRVYTLTLHLTNDGRHLIKVQSATTLKQLYELSAADILREFDGFTHAVYVWRHPTVADQRDSSQPNVDSLLDELVHRDGGKDLKWVRNLQGIRFKEKGDYEKAILMHEEAVALDPEFANTHDTLATALAKSKKYKEAFKEYEVATQKDSSYVTARYHWGAALNASGEKEKAKEQFSLAIDRGTSGRNAYYVKLAHVALGNRLLDEGNPDKAIEHYRSAIRLEYAYVYAYSSWGVALLCQGKPEDARKKFLLAIMHNGKLTKPIADLEEKIGKPNEATTSALCIQGKTLLEQCGGDDDDGDKPGCLG